MLSSRNRLLRVGYRTFGRTSLNYGMHLCMERAKRLHDIEWVSVSKYNAKTCDVILISFFWWAHFYDWAKFIVDANIDPRHARKPLIIIGGFQAYNFISLGSLFHWACIGDGEWFMSDALALVRNDRENEIERLDGAYWPGKETSTLWRSDPFSATAMQEPGQHITRIEIARGCKYKCAFCALTYLKPYRESSIEDTKALIAAAETKRVALFAPERLAHSGYDDIDCYVNDLGKKNAASDLRWDNLQGKAGYKGTILFGLEGMSERLRFGIGKHITDDDLVEGYQKLVQESEHGKRGIRFYIIVGLPGETAEDYEAWTSVLARLNETPEAKGMTLTPFVNTFMTQPHSPLQWAAAADIWTNYGKKFAKALWPHGHDDAKRWRMTIAFTPRIWGGTSRLKAQLAIRGDERVADVLLELATNPLLKAQVARPGMAGTTNFLRFLERHVGYNEDYLCGHLNPDDDYPWQKIRTYVPTETLKRRWFAYQRRVGMIGHDEYLRIKAARRFDDDKSEVGAPLFAEVAS